MRASLILRTAVAGLVALVASIAPAHAQPSSLVVLTSSGTVRDGLPVLELHPDPGTTLAVLERGFSGTMLRLYALEQEFLRRKDGTAPEPAYLLLSERQGGFPQFGLYLGDEKKPDTGWVDLHRGTPLSGRFGALDQIFPHELMHVIARQLAGAPRESGGNQVHAIGVRTDPVNAFAEGLAEAIQIVAVDHPDAIDDTRALRADAGIRERAERAVAAYARDLSSWWPLHPSRLGFVVWFSQSERAMRYHAVRANQFARMPAVPEALLAGADKYPAYLFSNVVPGGPGDEPKSASVMLSTEGVVSFLFWRFLSDPALQQRYASDEFYLQFGTTAAEVAPVENIFLKMFAALHAGRPSTSAELLRAYVELFPEEAQAVGGVIDEALVGQPLPDAPEIWLANAALMTGTSLFDQYRALARPHTFDVNAATMLDWLSVPGITSEEASMLLANAPFRSLEDVLGSPAIAAPLHGQIAGMAEAMDDLRTRAVEEEETLSLATIVLSYVWRLGLMVLACALCGAWLAVRAGTRRWWTAVSIAIVASVLAFGLAWVVIAPPWLPYVAPIIVGGGPLMLWRLARRQQGVVAVRGLVMWAAASVPALCVVLVT